MKKIIIMIVASLVITSAISHSAHALTLVAPQPENYSSAQHYYQDCLDINFSESQKVSLEADRYCQAITDVFFGE